MIPSNDAGAVLITKGLSHMSHIPGGRGGVVTGSYLDWLELLGIDAGPVPLAASSGHEGRDVWPRDLILEIVSPGGAQ